MFGELRRGVIFGDENIGKALVITHQHIEARLQLLDEICLQQQGFRLGGGGHKHH